ncbi:molecular chaperone DnaJ [Pseudanabaena sp. BC1403]
MLSTTQTTKSCHPCEGKGYISIRDCSGEIQREENCSFCNGSGKIEIEI